MSSFRVSVYRFWGGRRARLFSRVIVADSVEEARERALEDEDLKGLIPMGIEIDVVQESRTDE